MSSEQVTPRSAGDGPYRVEDYRPADSVGYLVKRVKAVLSAAIDREMSEFDVSHDQWATLIMLARGHCDTAAELSRVVVSDTGSMTRMIDRLEAKGLVQRSRCADDRRVVRLALTESGQRLADALLAVSVNVQNRHLAGFSVEELEQLKGFLRRILQNGAHGEMNE